MIHLHVRSWFSFLAAGSSGVWSPNSLSGNAALRQARCCGAVDSPETLVGIQALRDGPLASGAFGGRGRSRGETRVEGVLFPGRYCSRGEMLGNQVPPGPDHTLMCPAGFPRNLFPTNEMAAMGAASLPKPTPHFPSWFSGIKAEIHIAAEEGAARRKTRDWRCRLPPANRRARKYRNTCCYGSQAGMRTIPTNLRCDLPGVPVNDFVS